MAISIVNDNGHRRGYQVRVQRRGKMHTKYFTNRKRAEAYERQLKQILGPIASQKGKPKPTKAPNTGIKRIVRRVFQRNGRNPVDVYTIYWRTPDGEPRQSNVSIDYWGAEKAFRLAKKKKREMDQIQLGHAESVSKNSAKNKATKKNRIKPTPVRKKTAKRRLA
jgi:hypothetical protein